MAVERINRRRIVCPYTIEKKKKKNRIGIHFSNCNIHYSVKNWSIKIEYLGRIQLEKNFLLCYV